MPRDAWYVVEYIRNHLDQPLPGRAVQVAEMTNRISVV
jgi:hypothetical protein